jgi:thiamine-phosphate pyrophosphorylase
VVRIYLITDRRACPDLPSAVAAALSVLPIGTAAVQLREKDLPGGELLELARRLLPVCRSAKAPMLVNERVDVAKAARADGVHLPARGLPLREVREMLGPGALIGQSCHEPAEVARAAAGGADLALFGPIWATPGKDPQGVERLREAAKGAKLPVFAVGGVTARNAKLALRAGAHGVACIRAVLGAKNPATAALALWKALGD